MKQLKAKILENKKIAEGFYKMRIETPYLAKVSRPGQFLEVLCSDGNDPLLRRPLGVHRITKNSVEILYEIVGKGTELISRKKTGASLDVIGPLGNGFEIDQDRKTAVLVAGGIGVAPIAALAEELAGEGIKVHVIIGAKTKSHVMCEKELKRIASVKVSTEDGSKGREGLATDILKDALTLVNCQLTSIYACGPTGMLAAVAHIAKAKRIPCQVSLEERMACGVGVCLGCPVKVKNGKYKMVCKDGPVFNAEEIAW